MNSINNSCNAGIRERSLANPTWKGISKAYCYMGGAAITTAAVWLYFFNNKSVTTETSSGQLGVIEDVSDQALNVFGQTAADVTLIAIQGLTALGLLGVGFHSGKIEQNLALQRFEMDVPTIDKSLEICEIAPQMNEELIAFFKAYEGEIEQIYDELEKALKQVPGSAKSIEDAVSRKGRLQPFVEKIVVGKWNFLAIGASKVVMIHPKLKKYVFKFSIEGLNSSDLTSKSGNTVKSLRFHFEKLQQIRHLIEERQYKHITIPEVHLVETSKGPFLIEERLDFLKPWELMIETDEMNEAIEEAEDLRIEANLCDVSFKGVMHNCGWVQTSDFESSKLALIDVDCEQFYQGGAECGLFDEKDWCYSNEKPNTHCEVWHKPMK